MLIYMTQGHEASIPTTASLELPRLAYKGQAPQEKRFSFYLVSVMLLINYPSLCSCTPTLDVLSKASTSRLEFNWLYPYSILNNYMKFPIKLCISLNSYF